VIGVDSIFELIQIVPFPFFNHLTHITERPRIRESVLVVIPGSIGQEASSCSHCSIDDGSRSARKLVEPEFISLSRNDKELLQHL
jgi:hypothetical protein